MEFNLQYFLEMTRLMDEAIHERILEDDGTNTPYNVELSDIHGYLLAALGKYETAIKKESLEA